MCFPKDHENPQLRGQPKGMKAVLEERVSGWMEYNKICKARSTKVLKKCGECTKSQVLKDAERCVEKLEEMDHQGEIPSAEEVMAAEAVAPSALSDNKWCCMYWVISQQEDFLTEKPIIQSIIEEAGHVCLFLP